MDISGRAVSPHHVGMANATVRKTTAPRLRIVREREQALAQAREARRKLEGRQDAASDRFAYLRRTHD